MSDAIAELEQIKQELGAVDDPRYIHSAALRNGVIDKIGAEKFGALARHDPKNHFIDIESVLDYMLYSGDIDDPDFQKAYQHYHGRTGVLVNSNLAEHSDEVEEFYAAIQDLRRATTDAVAQKLEATNEQYGTIYEHGMREAIDFLGDGNTAPAMRAVSLFLQHPSQSAWEAVMRTKFDVSKLMAYFRSDISNKELFRGEMNGFSGSALLNLLDNLHKYQKPDTQGTVERTLKANNDLVWSVTNESAKPWEARFAEPKQRAEGNEHGGSGVGISLIEIHAAASGSVLQLPQVGSTHVSFGLTVPAHT